MGFIAQSEQLLSNYVTAAVRL